MATTDNSEAKTVQNVKNSLKFKAQERDAILSVRVGVKKYTLPVKARLLNSQKFLFLSFPASSELYRITGDGIEAMEKDEEAGEAYEALNPGRQARRRRGGSVDIPSDLANALRNIPNGYKIGYNADGSIKLVRTRQRKKS